ncbi:S1 family peptidase [Mycobacterium simiae]|uniref:S1 family peptidase n=1 Tax=Mycobacterium simiae TaxID=1784 RepID=UPI00263853E3|nr:serine protease [Mycobacterium simiae]
MQIPEPLKHCYARTLRVHDDQGKPCSSFVLGYEEQQWLVTARHVVQTDSGELRDFEVLETDGTSHSGSSLERLEMTFPFADVTVFRLWAEYVSLEPPLEPYRGEVIPTQRVYFLGFPDLGEPLRYGLRYDSLTTPFIKKAIVSGEVMHRSGLMNNIWLLDALAHHGFSGGPVLVREPKSEGYLVHGVISGYVPSNVRVLPGVVAATPMQIGDAPPLPHEAFSETNSGLAVCFGIGHALADIDAQLRADSAE